MTKSQPHKETDVYDWIEIIQNSSNAEVEKEKLVKAYENLVHSIAHKYSGNKSHHEDMFQVGIIGLLVAAKRFDKSFNRSFEAYAIPTIIGEIKRFIRDKTWSVHVPRRIKELGPQIKRTVEELTELNQKTPKIDEIATHLNVSEEDVLETMEMSSSYNTLSADSVQSNDASGEGLSILDLVGNQEVGYDKIDIQLLLENILPVLPKREQDVLECLFIEDLNQQQTADLLGISQMHVSRLRRQSLKKLRDALHKEGIYQF